MRISLIPSPAISLHYILSSPCLDLNISMFVHGDPSLPWYRQVVSVECLVAVYSVDELFMQIMLEIDRVL